jgi:hypothetical protein
MEEMFCQSSLEKWLIAGTITVDNAADTEVQPAVKAVAVEYQE